MNLDDNHEIFNSPSLSTIIDVPEDPYFLGNDSQSTLVPLEVPVKRKKARRRNKAMQTLLPEGVEIMEINPKKRLLCPTCQKPFPKPYDLTRHIRSHTGEKPFVCEYPGCGRGFVQVSSVI